MSRGAVLLLALGWTACGGDEGTRGVPPGSNPTIAPPPATMQPVGVAGAAPIAGGAAGPMTAMPGGAGMMAPATTGTAGTPSMPVAGGMATAGSAGSMTMTLAGMGGTTGASAGSGMPPPAGTGDPKDCPMPPAGASAESITAHTTVNAARVGAGSGCANLIAALNQSALAHCMYNAMNRGMASCAAGGHTEVMGCAGFTGADVAAREKAAGYSAVGATEVLTQYGNMPGPATQSWIDTVWHRIPILDPWTTDMGYGGGPGCDIIDFGRGMTGAPAETVVVYPYDGQTNVPLAFSGREAPVPPAPAGGWPSGYPINVYAQALKVSEHVLTKDGDSAPIEHVWMDASSSTVDPGYRFYLRTTAFLYANEPLEANTKYRVKIVGTHTGGALDVEWTFTTGTKRGA